MTVSGTTFAEICVEAALAAVAFYLFMVHTLTARNSFVNPGLFRDRNFNVGCLAIFTFGECVPSCSNHARHRSSG